MRLLPQDAPGVGGDKGRALQLGERPLEGLDGGQPVAALVERDGQVEEQLGLVVARVAAALEVADRLLPARVAVGGLAGQELPGWASATSLASWKASLTSAVPLAISRRWERSKASRSAADTGWSGGAATADCGRAGEVATGAAGRAGAEPAGGGEAADLAAPDPVAGGGGPGFGGLDPEEAEGAAGFAAFDPVAAGGAAGFAALDPVAAGWPARAELGAVDAGAGTLPGLPALPGPPFGGRALASSARQPCKALP